MNWKLKDGFLFCNTHKVDLCLPGKECVQVQDVIVVVLDVPPKQSMTENVFGVSLEGRVLWQIERIPETATDPVNRYTNVRTGQLGTAIVFNWNGTDITIDSRTGKVLDSVITK